MDAGNTTEVDVMGETRFTALDITAIILLLLIIIVGIIGNMIVVYVFGIKPGQSRKRFESFILLLGVIDLVSSILVPIPFLYLTLTNYQQWHFGLNGCRIISAFLPISVTISQGALILIAYERYKSIVYPFERHIKMASILAWIFFIFVLSIGLSIPYAMTLRLVTDDFYNINTCIPEENSNSMVLLSSCVNLSRDIVAAFILSFLTFRMTRALLKKQSSASVHRIAFSTKGRKLISLVTIVFMILTLPVDIYRVITFSLFETDIKISATVYELMTQMNTFLSILQMCNSICNVFIYSRVHKNFLPHFNALFRKLCQLRSNAQMKTELQIPFEETTLVSSQFEPVSL